MTQRQLGALLKLLRREGVTQYSDGDLSVVFGAAPVERQERQGKQFPPGPDVPAVEEMNPPPADEITDLRAWLEDKYRQLERSGGV